MADFSDVEDKYLVRFALKHEIAGTQISWIELSTKMKRWKGNKEKLRLRLKALKTRFGPNICDLPRRYLEDTPRQPMRVSNTIVTKKRLAAFTLEANAPPRRKHGDSTDVLAFDHSFGGMDSSILTSSVRLGDVASSSELPRTVLELFNASLDAVNSETSARDSSCALSSLCFAANFVCGAVDELVVAELECYAIVEKMFQSIPRADVRHKSSNPEQHMGEVSMVGVSALLSALEIKKKDVFMDVGAGIGNVLAQVALQSRAHKVLGIEVRERAVQLAKHVIADTAIHHRQLSKITMLAGDIRTLETTLLKSVESSTILYSFNTVFDHSTNMAIESLCCELSSLRLVALADKFCPRHERRPTCRNKFCTEWKLKEEVEVHVTYSSKPVSFYIYTRQ